MASEHEMVTIDIDPESELGKALASAGKRPLALISGGRRYDVFETEHDDVWADYDPEQVRAVVQAAAGSMTLEEGERLKQNIYRWREEGSRPIDRP